MNPMPVPIHRQRPEARTLTQCQRLALAGIVGVSLGLVYMGALILFFAK